MRLPPAVPTWVAQLELAGSSGLEGVVDVRPQPCHRRARVLVRLHQAPIGFLTIPIVDRTALADDVRHVAYDDFGSAIRSHLAADGIVVGAELAWSLPDRPADGVCGPSADADRAAGGGAAGPGISVVVCTRDRPDQLRQCLPRLADLAYDHYEVVIVDNAPTDSSTLAAFDALVGGDPRFRYVAAPEPGLSRARNRGLAEARHELVAFTDDDTLVDPGWLCGLVDGFARDPHVACVTGMIAPAELTSAAQQYFDRHAGWPAAVVPRLFDLGENADPAPSYPFSAGVFGAGANFAVDRSFVSDIGGFDPLLGAGTPTGGGEDLDIFVRVLFGGRRIAYEPSALVWHVHRANEQDLARQLRSWGTGLAAYVTKQLIEPRTRAEVLRRVPRTLAHIARAWLRATRSREMTSGGAPLSVPELRGIVAGMLIYARARRHRPTPTRA